MDYTVRKAAFEDLPRIHAIYAFARKFMAENGNPHQWGSNEPADELLQNDIAQGNLYVLTQRGNIHGVFAFILEEDPTYKVIHQGNWGSNSPYGTIHRIAGDGSGGILQNAVDYAWSKIHHLRIDTHHDNHIMQRAIMKQGFTQRGIIYVEDGSARIAYDRLP